MPRMPPSRLTLVVPYRAFGAEQVACCELVEECEVVMGRRDLCASPEGIVGEKVGEILSRNGRQSFSASELVDEGTQCAEAGGGRGYNGE